MYGMPMTISDDQFVQLILKHEWRVRAFSATVLGRFQDIDDVVQEVYAVAWSKRTEFEYSGDSPDEAFVRWVCTIGRYQSLKLRREQTTAGLVFDEELIERIVRFQFDDSAYLEARRRALKVCIEKLQATDQGLVRRRYGLDQPVCQIAKEDGKTISAIYKALNRIRRSLVACIGRALAQEGH